MSTVAEQIAHYIRGRDLLEALKKQHRAEEARVQTVLDKLEAGFLEALNSQGLQHIASPQGTIYKSERVSATVADWPLLLDWIRQQNAWDFLERRVSKAAVEQGLQDNGSLPPGVNLSRAFIVNVRRA